MSDTTQIIAIDGPAGAGKSSAAKCVAAKMGFSFLDTGAMYRAATWYALSQGISLDDADALTASTRAMNLDIEETDNGQRVTVNGEDVSEAIRTPEVTRVIYKLDQNSDVRKHLVDLQRTFGEKRPTVAEGRDIGTVVFPSAKCKIYLDASLDQRTQRRIQQLGDKAKGIDYDQLRAEIHERDEQSKNRKDSPLRQAEDAILLDSTDKTFDQVVKEIVLLAKERL
jgi:cytidylate kinase